MADLKKTPINPMLVILVIAAFAIGFLFSKVQNLEKQISGGNNSGSNAAADPGTQGEAPQAGEVDKVTSSDHIRGNLSKAKLALIEYSDFECPFCGQFHPTTKKVLDAYGDDVVIVYRHFPLSQIHPKAQKLAEASECVTDLGGKDTFWQFADKVFADQSITLEGLPALASSLGVNQAKFKTCLDGGKMAGEVDKDYQSGTKAGVTGTPGNILVNLKTGEKKLIPGAVPFETIKADIDAML